jgi:choline-sulfatase
LKASGRHRIKPCNTLFILSDEHQRDVTGCYGNALVKTPHLDALAARGTRFTRAYTPCPICVPARAALATGRHVFQTRAWDNAHPYHGEIPSWGHRLMQAQHEVVSIGKLHYRDSKDSNGFSEEILPLHVLDGVGDLLGLIRTPPAPRGNMPALSREAGPGASSYTDYDSEIAAAACRWLAQRKGKGPGKPWTLFVSFVRPHFPLVAPPEFFAMYPPDRMPLPRLYASGERPTHEAVKALRDCMNYDDYFDAQKVRVAVAAYYALVSFLDDNIGRVLRALDDAGLAGDTRVIYTSDHGDNLGNHGLWGKSVMYEESAAIPMILAGPDVPRGATTDGGASLIDCYRTLVEGAGVPLPAQDEVLPSQSLWEIARGGDPDRAVLSEYHAAGSVTGTYMVRRGRWKLVYFVGYPPQLFDLEDDPHESTDLAAQPSMKGVLKECEAALRALLDPEKVSARAFADQAARLAANGGAAAVLARGDFGYTPAPGETAGFA